MRYGLGVVELVGEDGGKRVRRKVGFGLGFLRIIVGRVVVRVRVRVMLKVGVRGKG